MMFSSRKPKRERGPKNCKKREEQNTKGKTKGKQQENKEKPRKERRKKTESIKKTFQCRMLEDKRQERKKFQLLELQWQYDVCM
jgi:hypothetical protein